MPDAMPSLCRQAFMLSQIGDTSALLTLGTMSATLSVGDTHLITPQMTQPQNAHYEQY
jgi:hypothetical protein